MPRKQPIREQFNTLTDENKQKVLELGEALRRGYEDPVFFTEYFLGMGLHDGQKDFLRKSDVVYNPATTRKNILVPCNRWGKMLSDNEPILTFDGWKKNGEIKLGDKVVSQDGNETEVVGVFPQGKQDIYRLIFNDGSYSDCGLEHLWLCQTREGRFTKNYNENRKEYPNKNYKKWKVLSTKNIIEYGGMNPSSERAIIIPMVSPVNFPVKEVPFSPYLLGLLLGDGSLSKSGIRFTTADKELLEGFDYVFSGRYDYRIKGLKEAIKELGLEDKKSWNKFVPKNYLWNSVENRLSLLQGLMDTDGNIELNGKIEYCTTSKQLSEDVKFIVQSLGGTAIISERTTSYLYKGEKKNGRLSYRVRIKIKICPFKLKRKSVRFYITCRTYNRILKKIESLGKQSATCLQVNNPSHLYVTRDFIVTHNTVALAAKHIRYNFYKIGADREMAQDALRDLRYGTLDLSPHSNQVVACFNFIFDILHNRFVTIVDGKKQANKCLIQSFYISKNDSQKRVIFSNHSSFFGASTGEDQGASLAGRQFGYISYDECVFSHHLRMELPGRIMSRTIDMNAPIDLVSTYDTEAKSQQYYFGLVKKALKGQNEWWCKTGVYQDNFFIPEEIKEAAKEKIMGEDFNKYRQVFLGEAVPSSIKIFEPEIVDNIFSDNLVPSPSAVSHEYLISVDWGGSDQGDPTVMLVIDYWNRKYTIVHHEIVKGGSPTLQFALLKTLKEEYNNAMVIMDTNALGGVLIKKLLAEMGVKVYDFDAHRGEKGEAVTQLKLAMSHNRRYEVKEGKIVELHPEYGLIRSYYIPELEDQLGAYEVDDKRLEQDMVVALYMGIWLLEKKNRKPKEKVFLLTRKHQ